MTCMNLLRNLFIMGALSFSCISVASDTDNGHSYDGVSAIVFRESTIGSAHLGHL